jgi:hypothetical protein
MVYYTRLRSKDPLMLDISAFCCYYTIMARYELVSLNASIEEPHFFDRSTNGKNGKFFTEKMGIFVLGQYSTAYQNCIRAIMDGIVAFGTGHAMTKAGTSTMACPFGFEDFDLTGSNENHYGKGARLIIPYVRTDLAVSPGVSPRDAVEIYQRYLVDTTNTALESVKSPYRLDVSGLRDIDGQYT